MSSQLGRSSTPSSAAALSDNASFLPTHDLISTVESGDARRLHRLLLTATPGTCSWRDSHGNTVLHKAAALPLPDCLIELLQSPVRFIFAPNEQGETPLHIAASNESTLLPFLLLVKKYGVVSQVDQAKNTVLHLVLANEEIDDEQLVALMGSLLDRADAASLVNAVNARGLTPYDIVCTRFSSEPALVELLLKYGAVSGALLFHDALQFLFSSEEESRNRVVEYAQKAFSIIHASEEARRALIHAQLHQRRKLITYEKTQRRNLYAKEATTWETIQGRATHSVRQIMELLDERDCCARMLQRIGKGCVARRRVRALAQQREEERLLAEANARAIALLSAQEEDLLLAKASSPSADAENVAVANAPRPAGPYELPLRDLPEKLLCHLQAKMKARRTRREYLRLRGKLVMLQRAWRCHHALVVRQRQRATDVLRSKLQKHAFHHACSALVQQLMTAHFTTMLREVARLVTQLVWRENFCSVFHSIVFMRKRQGPPPPPPRPSRFRRMQALAVRFELYTVVAQVLVSLFLLVYMGCIPRTSVTRVHNSVDIAFVCLQLVLACCLPLCWWRLWDAAVILTSLACAAASRYGGTVVITLFTLKIPFAIHLLAPQHSGTSTYCRAIEYSVTYSLIFLPFGLAGIGSTVRGAAVSAQLLTSHGNWGSVFLLLLNTVSPQKVTLSLKSENEMAVPGSVLLSSRSQQVSDASSAAAELYRFEVPLVQLSVFRVVTWVYWWSALVVGTHNAIRYHYDISDETKLKLNKHRFRNKDKAKLFDAHRATTIEALGQQLDGVMWEDDVRAAKEAVDASHYDHNTNFMVHRFVRRVQDSLGYQNGAVTTGQAQQRTARNTKRVANSVRQWDCRNEDPPSRGKYDIEVVETALGMSEHKGATERFIERQWTGSLLRKEVNWILIGMLVMAAVKPNVYAMEIVFSSLFVVELVLSLCFLRLEFILSHYVRLLLRVFCAVVGFIPLAIPFVALRSLRLLEGLSLLFSIPGMVRWCFVYLMASFVTLWMIAYVAALQFLSAAQLTGRTSICSSKSECLAISLRELLIPAFTPAHIDPTSEAPVMAMLVVFTHLCYTPFFLSIALHPLLRLSNFIGRFLRLVVRSLHSDVVNYLENYLEGNSWFTHWCLKTELSVSVVTQLRMWIYDIRRRHFCIARGSTLPDCEGASRPPTSQGTAVTSYGLGPEYEDGVLTEIICRRRFATFEENDVEDRTHRQGWRLFLSRTVIRNTCAHYLNAVLTLASIAFLWVVDASLNRSAALVAVSTVVHLVSVVVSLVLMPRDSTALMTLVSASSLFCAVVLLLLPGWRFHEYYCIRFLSLLRLGQLQVFPFRRLKEVVKMFINSAVTILFPIAMAGGAAYIAELLRAQIFMVQFSSREAAAVNWSSPAEVARFRASVSYEEFLASVPRAHTSRPNTAETADLFAAYFIDDAFIFFSIFNFWVLPAICITTCLSYLFWLGENLRDTNRLMIDMIPLLEDPITTSGFGWYQWLYRPVGNIVLLASLVFGCIFSPSTTATADDHNFFLAFELAFTLCGIAEAILSCSFAVHRCGRSSASWRTSEEAAKRASVLFGDFVFLLCEVVQLLYYCIAAVLSATLLLERNGCLISPDEYATFFITLRFLFLLRILGRELLLVFMRNIAPVLLIVASIVAFFVAATSAVVDVYAFATHTRYTTERWWDALNVVLRLTFTAAIPTHFDGHWHPFNGTGISSAFGNNASASNVINETYITSRLAFALATFGKAILACAVGILIASVMVPVRTVFLQPLPPQSLLLYQTLCGGLNKLVRFGVRHHDDMQPERRCRIQARKFARIFTPAGIPSWAVPHLLEELNICRPARQRRFMYALMRLLEYLPASERRQTFVQEYMHLWDTYKSGGPAHLLFSELPVYPHAVATLWATNPYATVTKKATQRQERYIAPLRLVQALTIFELGFPADSSVGSKLWMDFFSVVQKMRGATLLQSLWRMYREEKSFDENPANSFYDRAWIAHLRRRFRRQKTRSNIAFLKFLSFEEAVEHERETFNPNTGHFDLLNRLRGHFDSLKASINFWSMMRDLENSAP